MRSALTCPDVHRALTGEWTRPGLSAEVRVHLAECDPCSGYLSELRRRPAALRALAPPMGAGIGTAMLAQLRDVLRGLRR